MNCPPCSKNCRQSRDCPAPRPPLPRWVISIRKAAFRAAFAIELAWNTAQDMAACYRVRRAAGFRRLTSIRIAFDAQLPAKKGTK